MASFSTKSFERKLKEMSSRQDSVQTVSLWLIHHRAHSKAVVSVWHEHVKKAKPERRLILFYLANDVIQNSRKKGKEFSNSFSKVLLDSMSYLRDSQIRPSVERVLKIWQERKVFPKDIVQKLIAQLYRVSKPEPKVETKTSEKKVVKPKVKRQVPASFKVSNVIGAMVAMQEHENETQRRETKVSQMRLDASSSDGIKQLKDRTGGNRFSLEFEESSSKIEELVASLEEENQHRHILINKLEDSNAYYEAALKEATIIANAYHSFGNRLHAMKKKLDNKIRKFATAEKEAPVSAPKASFLAGGLKGILKEVNRSPSGSVEKEDDEKKEESETKETVEEKVENEVEEKIAKEEKVVDPTIDHVEVSDMDIESDSDEEAASDSIAPQETPETNSNTNGSAVSTPSLNTPAVTESPSLVTEASKTEEAVTEETPSSAAQQFGYTMTAESTEDTAGFSPASRDSAPSPEGSPDLNLEQYEDGFPGQDSGAKALINTNITSDSGSQNPVNLLAQLISKTRRQNASAENSPQRGSQQDTEEITESKPLLNTFDSVFPAFGTSHGPVGEQVEHVEDNQGQGMYEEGHEGDFHQLPVNTTDETIGDNIVDKIAPTSEADAVVSKETQADDQAQSQLVQDSNQKHQDGDLTPEHGSETPEFGEEAHEFGEGAPIIIRSGSEFHRYPGLSPSHGRIPDGHHLVDDRQFLVDSLPPGMEPGPFIRDGMRRGSLDELMIDERPPRGLTSPDIRSPRMAPPADWERWPPPRDGFLPRDRDGIILDNRPIERFAPVDRRLDPRLRDRAEDLRPPYRPRGEMEEFERKHFERDSFEREQFHRLDDFASQPRRDYRPTDPRIERRLLGNRGAYPLPERREEGRPIGEHEGFIETDAELLPRVRPGPSIDLDEREDLQPVRPYAREKSPLDNRPEFHPLDRREEMLERRDDFREFPPRGGNYSPHYRPRGVYRSDPPTRGFHARFSRPRGSHPGGAPRGFPPEMRLKRPGPPFSVDAKRPHF